MAHGSWPIAHGSWFMAHGFWLMAPGSGAQGLIHDSWRIAHGQERGGDGGTRSLAAVQSAIWSTGRVGYLEALMEGEIERQVGDNETDRQ